MLRIFLVLILLISEADAASKLSKTTFKRVLSILKSHYQYKAQERGSLLEFYTDYDNDWAQAFARRWDTDQVHIYGGVAAINQSTEDTLALFICHELGHLYGGSPYSDTHNELSVEGQADYWAASECMPKIIPKLSYLEASSSSESHCEGDNVCARTLDASYALANFFADNAKNPHPDLSTPDQSIVVQVLKTHPSAQCRLDTFWAGLKLSNPPRCWHPGTLPQTSYQVR